MFITVEGIDGSGKSTFVRKLKRELENNGKTVFLTAEPRIKNLDGSENKFAKGIISIINKENIKDDKILFNFFSSIRRTNSGIIIEALNKYDYVICDRYIDSSSVYQKKHDELMIIVPDLTVFLNTDPKVALERINKRKSKVGAIKYFEKAFANIEDLEHLKLGYEDLLIEGLAPHQKRVILNIKNSHTKNKKYWDGFIDTLKKYNKTISQNHKIFPSVKLDYKILSELMNERLKESDKKNEK